MFIELTLFAYLIDLVVGEIKMRHPVAFMGDFIQWFEKAFYDDSMLRGGWLTLSLLTLVFLIVYGVTFLISYLPCPLALIVLSILSSTGIAGHMLYNSVKGVLESDHPRDALAMLVSRDTQNLSPSDIYKGSIETYAENLSDGVIAPILYLFFFGLEGIALYKAINTLDSMIGYRNDRYSRFGKVSARLDDIANFVPARLTALLIAVFSFRWSSFRAIILYGHKHESWNAGYPISAMAGALAISLGGDTSYHGEIKKKADFNDGRKDLTEKDVRKTLRYRYWIDSFIVGGLILLWINK
ncbi:MAG: cobalamin biosynthesis protein CobD [bacterium]|nr:MAG: cobalamin biosynthesis protein CobD [bacterium]